VILLDTHIWLNWVILGEDALPAGIREAVAGAEQLGVSAISCFEVTLLARRGRVLLSCEPEEWLQKALAPSGVECLPITCEIARRAVELPEHHRDPADRLIIATALHYSAKLASVDSLIGQYTELSNALLSS